MDFITKEKKDLLGSRELAVPPDIAKLNAQFHLYTGITTHSHGFEGWEQGKLEDKPTTVYDLSGLPLFYDFSLRNDSLSLGLIRTTANKALGGTIMSTYITPPTWDVEKAQKRLQKIVKEKYLRYEIKNIQVVCYSYPKLALKAELSSPTEETKLFLLDIGDFTEISMTPKLDLKISGQIAYSFLNQIPEGNIKNNPEIWNQTSHEIEKVFDKEKTLDPFQISKKTPIERVKIIEKSINKLMSKPVDLVPIPIPWYVEKTLHFCSHHGCYHECFCLHPQENSVHCTRASSQMVLCYWRYKYSQHEIAQAFGAPDNQGTSWSAVAPGLNSLTHNCFTAALDYSVTWNECTNEIENSRPFLADTGGHTRACAGVKWWNIWWYPNPVPRYLYIFDPWPPQPDENSVPITGGAIYWEDFNTGSHAWNGTLVRKTTNHP